MVGKNRDNKGVNIKNTIGERKRADHIAMGGEPLHGLIHGFGKNVAEGDGAADGNPKMGRIRLEGQVRPRT